MDKYKFGEFIYQRRKKIGLTQEELGRKLGVTNKAVSKWEVGETLPEVTMLEPLANILQVSVDDLLKQKDSKEEEKKTIKLNKLLLIMSIIVMALNVFIITFGLAYLNYQNNKLEPVIIDNNNIEGIVDIDAMSNFVCDYQEITIISNYKLNDMYYLLEDTVVTFEIQFEITYYYYLEDNSLGIISYLSRTEQVVLDNNLNKELKITLEPKNEINNFKHFKNLNIEYTIISYDGTVYKVK